jgi:dTMP kinase
MKENVNRANGKKGVLIVFEGLSGSGKSLNAGLLLKNLRDKGYEPVLTEWNSNKTIRRFSAWLDSRRMLSSDIYSFLQWISFLLDYFRIILPTLRSRKIVIADRYVYTGITRDSINGARKRLGLLIASVVRKPDYIYFLDTPSHICLDRLKARNKALFHTNRRIRENKLIKNKDLYYLNKMRYAYNRLFTESEQLNIKRVTQTDPKNGIAQWDTVYQICETKIMKFQGDTLMCKKEIENRICAILKNYCQYNGDNIVVDKDLRENYGVDSLILVELLVDIEAGFGITFDNEMLTYEHFSTVAALADYVFEKVGGDQEVSCV